MLGRGLPDGAERRHDRTPSLRLTSRQLCDLELIGNGAFAPLTTFLGRVDYESVCERMRLADGSLWPIPVVLDVPEALLRSARRDVLALHDQHDNNLALLRVTEAWRPDRLAEADLVLGTTSVAHPGVAHLLGCTHAWYVSGELSILRRPSRPELAPLVQTPAEVKAEFARRGWQRVVAFNTRNPMHGAHRALVLRAARSEQANLLIHPVVGPTQPGDLPATVRVRCYQAMMRTLPAERAMLSLLPLAMRMAGPREAVWHAIIRRNYGATALVVGRDHAGPGEDPSGRPFYDPYDAQRLVAAHQEELGIRMVAARELLYVEGVGYLPREEIPPGASARLVSGTLVRQLLAQGSAIPPWLMPAEVAAELVNGDRGSAQSSA